MSDIHRHNRIWHLLRRLPAEGHSDSWDEAMHEARQPRFSTTNFELACDVRSARKCVTSWVQRPTVLPIPTNEATLLNALSQFQLMPTRSIVLGHLLHQKLACDSWLNAM